MKVYLDNAATTPMAPEIIELMSEMMKTTFANPSSVHEFGRKSKIIVETARKTIAALLNTAPKTIFFTSGGTEADNMAIKCGIHDHNITHAITSKLSHHAVLYPLEDLAAEEKIKLSYIDTDENGEVSLSHLKQLLEDNERTFVSIMHANNEIGTIQDLKQIGEICKEYNAIFHSDTVQTMGHYTFDMQELNVDFMAASAHKFHGPKGIGFIYVSEDIQIKPLLRGGGQERNMRAGTENIYGIAALAKAMEMAYSHLEEETKYINGLKSYMIDKLKAEIPEVEFYANCTDLNNSLYTVLSVSFPVTKIAEMLLFNLDILGIACSGGSACSSGSSTGSHVLSAIAPDSTRPGVRFSFSKYNTKEEIDYTINQLKSLFN
ncbi:MAG: cysteine desulfurase [Flavobacteriales bacterium]|jgi:cysteine desulfurase|nr:cysteine desulfurase [Flavobacteriales bacterium]MBT4881403.1 cysteine desulfurase [Flavobacteriales bacterium]MDG1349254.1 cysteine desulfurase family protein [Flavobacteriales bacterium]